MDLPPLVDAHHHLWDTDVLPYAWLRSSALPRRYLVPDLLADAASSNLVRSVHVQAEVDRARSVEETRWLQGVADRHGFPHAIVAYADLSAPDVAAVLDAHAACPGVRGVRQILNWDPDPARSQCDRPDYLTDPAWRAGYAELGRRGLSFDLQAYPWQMRDAADVAGAHPGTPMIVDHTGMPSFDAPGGRQAWRQGMAALADRPNVSVKISGFAMFDAAWTEDMIRPWVLETIELFGVERCMFASNFPVDRPARSYEDTFAAFRRIVAGLGEDERRRLFHDNAARIYRLDREEV